MNELIQVNYDNDRPTVLARDLHEFLEVQTPYHKWFPRMCEYGFSENIDYMMMDKNVLRSDGTKMPQIQHDAQLTIEMAKEICMLQRNERGKQARQYFIQLEKDWNRPELVMARALKMANSRIGSLEERTVHLEQKIEKDKPKVLFADAVSVSGSAILIGDLAKILRQNGVEMGPNRLFQWLRENGYLIKQKGSSYNMPTQKSMELGLFKIKETCVTHSDGHTSINRTPKVTGKGQVYLLNKILGRKVEQTELEEKAE